jgi:cytochrome c
MMMIVAGIERRPPQAWRQKVASWPRLYVLPSLPQSANHRSNSRSARALIKPQSMRKPQVSGEFGGRMTGYEFNKIAGAVLGCLLFAQSVALISDAIFSHKTPAKQGYALQAPQEATSPEGKSAPEVPLATLLAKADPKKGEDDTRPCQACHNFEKGAGVKIGPPLYGVVGRPRASVPGFDYSDAMKAKGGTWTFDEIF